VSAGDDPRVILTFEKTLDTIRAEQALLRAGVDAAVMPLPGDLGKRCGMALRVPPADVSEALAATREIHGVRVYRRTADDRWEEAR